MHRPDETIAAPATAPGEGALAVIRISGPGAFDALRALCGQRRDILDIAPRHLEYAHLFDADGSRLDEALVVRFPGPASYTGEDMVEVQTHGGPVTVKAVLDALFTRGVKPAHPGEFTFRAYLSGRLDLTQAEAVADLIRSRTGKARDLALDHLAGSMKRRIAPLRRRLLDLLRDLEAGIDFIEEDISFVDRREIAAALAGIGEEVDALLAGEAEGALLRNGVTVTLAGPPNAGKSSLFNALLEEERAIVTPTPGTTRDMLSESWVHRGVVYHLRDTAGIRATEDGVERLGVERSEAALREAQIRLLVFDGAAPPTGDEKRMIDGGARAIVVLNKSDLPGFAADALAGAAGNRPRIALSAKTGAGLEALKEALHRLATEGVVQKQLGERVAVNRRQGAKLRAIRSILDELSPGNMAEMEDEILARQLREALAELDELSGEKVGDEILSEIFSNFCVGK